MGTQAGATHVDRALLQRARGEFNEVPGLRLTVAQASRLWNTDTDTSVQILNALVAGAFLRQTGQYYVRADSELRTKN